MTAYELTSIISIYFMVRPRIEGDVTGVLAVPADHRAHPNNKYLAKVNDRDKMLLSGIFKPMMFLSFPFAIKG